MAGNFNVLSRKIIIPFYRPTSRINMVSLQHNRKYIQSYDGDTKNNDFSLLPIICLYLIQIYVIFLFMMGNRLKDLMKREKVTAYRVCKDLGIDHGNFWRFLHKNAGLSLEKFLQVVGYLGYDIKFVKRRRSRKGDE